MVFCDDLEVWGEGLGVGGRLKREDIYVFLWLIHVGIWQKQIRQL